MIRIRFSSARETSVDFLSCRLRFDVLDVKMWLRNAFRRFNLPDAVMMNFFAALRLLFIFGMVLFLADFSLCWTASCFRCPFFLVAVRSKIHDHVSTFQMGRLICLRYVLKFLRQTLQ